MNIQIKHNTKNNSNNNSIYNNINTNKSKKLLEKAESIAKLESFINNLNLKIYSKQDFSKFKDIKVSCQARIIKTTMQNSNTKVVIKAITPKYSINSFIKEVSFLVKYKNECIPKVYGLYKEKTLSGQDLLGIVIEYIEGYTLKKILEEESLYNTENISNFELDIIKNIKDNNLLNKTNIINNLENSVIHYKIIIKFYWIIKLCQAIKFMHDNYILHLDLKPDNIIVDILGNIKLIDFGSCITVDNLTKEVYINDDKYSFTPSYVIPEAIHFSVNPIKIDKNNFVKYNISNYNNNTNNNCLTYFDFINQKKLKLKKAFNLNEHDNYIKLHLKSDIWALGLIIIEVFTLFKPWCNNKHDNKDYYQIVTMISKKYKYNMPDFNIFDNKNLNRIIKLLIKRCLHYNYDLRPDINYIIENILEIFNLYLINKEISNKKIKKSIVLNGNTYQLISNNNNTYDFNFQSRNLNNSKIYNSQSFSYTKSKNKLNIFTDLDNNRIYKSFTNYNKTLLNNYNYTDLCDDSLYNPSIAEFKTTISNSKYNISNLESNTTSKLSQNSSYYLIKKLEVIKSFICTIKRDLCEKLSKTFSNNNIKTNKIENFVNINNNCLNYTLLSNNYSLFSLINKNIHEIKSLLYNNISFKVNTLSLDNIQLQNTLNNNYFMNCYNNLNIEIKNNIIKLNNCKILSNKNTNKNLINLNVKNNLNDINYYMNYNFYDDSIYLLNYRNKRTTKKKNIIKDLFNSEIIILKPFSYLYLNRYLILIGGRIINVKLDNNMFGKLKFELEELYGYNTNSYDFYINYFFKESSFPSNICCIYSVILNKTFILPNYNYPRDKCSCIIKENKLYLIGGESKYIEELNLELLLVKLEDISRKVLYNDNKTNSYSNYLEINDIQLYINKNLNWIIIHNLLILSSNNYFNCISNSNNKDEFYVDTGCLFVNKFDCIVLIEKNIINSEIKYYCINVTNKTLYSYTINLYNYLDKEVMHEILAHGKAEISSQFENIYSINYTKLLIIKTFNKNVNGSHSLKNNNTPIDSSNDLYKVLINFNFVRNTSSIISFCSCNCNFNFNILGNNTFDTFDCSNYFLNIDKNKNKNTTQIKHICIDNII